MSEKVYIAGVGVISAIGRNVAETLLSLENHQAAIASMTLLDSVHRGRLPRQHSAG